MPGIESLTLPSLSLALDAAVMRHQVIASNIANVHTVGYVPQHLTFEAEMSRASQGRVTPTGRSAAEGESMTLNVRMDAPLCGGKGSRCERNNSRGRRPAKGELSLIT